MRNLLVSILRAILCVVPIYGAAEMIHSKEAFYRLFGWFLCWIVLDIYGWLKYELLPDRDPVTKAIIRKVMIETKVDIEGWEPKDIEVTKDEAHFMSIFKHIPTGVKIIIKHPPNKLTIGDGD